MRLDFIYLIKSFVFSAEASEITESVSPGLRVLEEMNSNSLADLSPGYFNQRIVTGEGSSYEDGLVDGSGKRRWIFSNGDRYEGEFVKGKFQGVGKYFYADGSFYEGNFFLITNFMVRASGPLLTEPVT